MDFRTSSSASDLFVTEGLGGVRLVFGVWCVLSV